MTGDDLVLGAVDANAVPTFSKAILSRTQNTDVAKPTHITCTTAPQPEIQSLSTAASRVCEMVSKRSSGSYQNGKSRHTPHGECQQRFERQQGDDDWLLTRSGSHNPSATPYSLSVAVPATTKSLGVVIHPMLSKSVDDDVIVVSSTRPMVQREETRMTHVSMLQMKGFGFGSMADGAGIPAMTGSIKYGPNLACPQRTSIVSAFTLLPALK